MADGSVSPAQGAVESNGFYVYILYRPDGRPCYVGKGTGDRWKRHQWRARRKLANPHLEHILRNAGGTLPMHKVASELPEAEAFELERFLISAIGREAQGGPLVNLTDGGEGPAGFKFSAESRARMSRSHMGKPAPWNKGRSMSVDARAKMRAAKLGTKQSQVTRDKRSASMRGRTVSVEARLKLSAARAGMKFTAEWREHLRQAWIRRRQKASST